MRKDGLIQNRLFLSVLVVVVAFMAACAQGEIVSFGSAPEQDAFHFWLSYPTPVTVAGPDRNRSLSVIADLRDDPLRPPFSLTDGNGRFSEPLQPPARVPLDYPPNLSHDGWGITSGAWRTLFASTDSFPSGIEIIYEDATVHLFIPYDDPDDPSIREGHKLLRGSNDFPYRIWSSLEDYFLFARAGESYVTSEMPTIPEPSSCAVAIAAVSAAIVVLRRGRTRGDLRNRIAHSVLLITVAIIPVSTHAGIVSFGSGAEPDAFHFWFTYESAEIASSVGVTRNVSIDAYLLNDPSRPPHVLTDGNGRFSEPLQPPAIIPIRLGPNYPSQAIRQENLLGIHPFIPALDRGSVVTYSDDTVNLYVPHDSLKHRGTFLYFVNDNSERLLLAETGESYVVSQIPAIPEPATFVLAVGAAPIGILALRQSHFTSQSRACAK